MLHFQNGRFEFQAFQARSKRLFSIIQFSLHGYKSVSKMYCIMLQLVTSIVIVTLLTFTYQLLHLTYLLLPITYLLLPITYLLLLITYQLSTYYLPIAIYYLPIATYYLAIAANYLPIPTYHLPITTYYLPKILISRCRSLVSIQRKWKGVLKMKRANLAATLLGQKNIYLLVAMMIHKFLSVLLLRDL